MLDSLRDRITKALSSLRGSRKLTEKNIDETLQQVRRVLLEADVALPVIRQFIEQVKARTVNTQVMDSLTPEQTIISIVHEEMTALLGEANVPINRAEFGPSVILLAGLQGSGKTTTAGKLAHHLIEQEKQRVLLVSIDLYRPAAIEQLKTLAQQVTAEFWETDVSHAPEKIAKAAVAHARKSSIDTIIIDSAGRLHVDETMMHEIQQVQQLIAPHETLFVIDAMIGQDAVNSASAFNDALELTGVIVTKLDSDARGGALMSVRQVTGKPVKFVGTGEGVNALEKFHPDRTASRIIGLGDMLTLIESVQQKTNEEKAKQWEQKLRKGSRLDLADYREQMRMMLDMGGVKNLTSMMPESSAVKQLNSDNADQDLRREIAIIDSMTPHERRFPAAIRASRRARIALGSGVEVRHVNQLLRKYEKLQRNLKKMVRQKGNMNVPGMDQLTDRFPM